LNAAAGPFAIATVAVPAGNGFGGGTIYHPTEAGTYGAISFVNGFLTGAPTADAQRLATHGFVTFAINTNSPFDFPDSRATQLVASLNYLINTSTVRSRVDRARLGAAGISMGGGGALIAARSNPALVKSVVGLIPWNNSGTFTTLQTPTFILAGETDPIAPPASHGLAFYNSIPASVRKAYGEQNDTGHGYNAPTTQRYYVSWSKRFLDNDTRYSTFLCGAEHTAYATPTIFSRYLANCPY
jgi:triacylglycerol lipase